MHLTHIRRFGVLAVVIASTLAGITANAIAATPPRPSAFAVRNVQSGAWSNPGTWAGGQLPADGASITVAAGTTVVLDRDARVTGADIAGTLTFDPTRNVSLYSSRNVIVRGILGMAPASAPIVHRLRFVD